MLVMRMMLASSRQRLSSTPHATFITSQCDPRFRPASWRNGIEELKMGSRQPWQVTTNDRKDAVKGSIDGNDSNESH